MIEAFRQRVRKHPFVAAVLSIASGTAFAQIVSIGLAPVISRLYDPNEFAGLAVFTAIVGVFLPAISGRYEIAIAVAPTEHESADLFVLSMVVATALTATLFVVVSVFGTWFAQVFSAESIGSWIMLVPVFLALSAFVEAYRYLSVSRKEHRTVSRVIIVQAVLTVLLKLILGLFLGTSDALILSTLIGAAGTWIFVVMKDRRLPAILRASKLGDLKSLARRYRGFPLLNAPSSLIAGLTSSIPVFFLAEYFSSTSVGHYALMLKAITLPLGVISTAVSQVHLKHVSDLVNTDKPIVPYLLRLSGSLLLVVLLPTAVMVVFGEPLIRFAFGDEWGLSGTMSSILMPAIGFKFVVTTVSSVFGATGNNKLAALWRVISLVVTASAYRFIGVHLDVLGFIRLMAITEIVNYAIYYSFIVVAVRNPKKY